MSPGIVQEVSGLCGEVDSSLSWAENSSEPQAENVTVASAKRSQDNLATHQRAVKEKSIKKTPRNGVFSMLMHEC